MPEGDGMYRKNLGMHPHEGTVYVVAGHGSGGSVNAVHPLMVAQSNGAGSCVLKINGATLDFYSVLATGEIADSFQIFKGPLSDLNGDGVVNIQDLLAVIGAWGSCSACIEDINTDGTVDVSDILLLIADWG